MQVDLPAEVVQLCRSLLETLEEQHKVDLGERSALMTSVEAEVSYIKSVQSSTRGLIMQFAKDVRALCAAYGSDYLALESMHYVMSSMVHMQMQAARDPTGWWSVVP